MKKLDYLLLYFYSQWWLRSFVIPFSILLVFSGANFFQIFPCFSHSYFGFSLTLALTALVVLIIKITQFVTVHAVQQR